MLMRFLELKNNLLKTNLVLFTSITALNFVKIYMTVKSIICTSNLIVYLLFYISFLSLKAIFQKRKIKCIAIINFMLIINN